VRFRASRPPLRAVALTTDTSLLTACANDMGFDAVFARQVEAHGRPGDVLVLHSTSGDSPNVVRAAQSARARGVTVIAFLGKGGGELRKLDAELPLFDVKTLPERLAGYQTILDRLLAKNPADRFQSARELFATIAV